MLKNNFIKIFLFIIIGMSIPFVVMAKPLPQSSVNQPLPQTSVSTKIEDPLGGKDFTDITKDIISWLVNIGISLAVIMIMYAGFLWMTSGGDETKVTKARQTLIWSLVGLGVLIIGRGFVSILQELLGVS